MIITYILDDYSDNTPVAYFFTYTNNLGFYAVTINPSECIWIVPGTTNDLEDIL